MAVKLMIVILILMAIGSTKPIYKSEEPIGHKQIAENKFIVYFEDGDFMVVTGNTVVVQRQVGTMFLGCLEVMK